MLAAQWDTLLRFAWAVDYGNEDPVFGRDLGFYLFTLPYFEVIQNAAAVGSLLVLATLLWLYVAIGKVRSEQEARSRSNREPCGIWL